MEAIVPRTGGAFASSLIAALVVVMAVPLQAQKIDIGLRKGDSVVVAVPMHFARPRWAPPYATTDKLDLDVRRGPQGGVEVMDSARVWQATWRTESFPSLVAYEFRGVK